MKPVIKCIIFDCDGILVDSEPIAISTLVNMAIALGAPIDYEFGIREFQGNSMGGVMEIIQGLIKQPLPDNFEQKYRKTSFERFTKELQPIPNITEVIQQLSIPYCVASSGPPHKIQHTLKTVGLLPYFKDHIFSCYQLNRWKPDPAIYIHAAKTMGFHPTECLVVEDSLPGVEAGIASGATVYAYATNSHDKEALAEAGGILFYEMLDLLDVISPRTSEVTIKK